ncbi:glycosyl hydrolase family 95 catalytic domain-containing protein [Echinicola salinicaeni]|uniref:glycosyl hydrolase family 95 catalytic domain-containing protein n=1 Tax=Echinicola salinicaeni TaxID=2762757 RepID=UPI001647D06F|nr:hypothetical protein [Echinicola salinicaeni]
MEKLERLPILYKKAPQKIPSSSSVDAPFLGNGYTKVAVSGNPEKQVFHFGRNDFWRLKSAYNESFPAVLGKMEVHIPALKGATYHLEQYLGQAITTANFEKNDQKVSYEVYMSANEDLMILELSMEGKGELPVQLNLSLPGEVESAINPPMDLLFPASTKYSQTEEGIVFFSRAFEKEVDIPTKAAVGMKILSNEGTFFILQEDKPVTIVLAFSSNFKSDDCEMAVVDRLRDLDINDLASIKEGHLAWWEKYWNSSQVNIGDELLEKQYYLSQYNMGSLSRDPDFPPGIFGLVTKERPAWNGDYHLNYNHYAPFYGLFSSNHLEQASTVNAPLLALIDRGEYYSDKLTGIQGGIMLPVGAGPVGIETTRRNEIVDKFVHRYIEEGNIEDEGLFFGQKSNAAYGMVNMSTHFYLTYDKAVAAKYYPYVKGVATFWKNYLTWEKGRYVIYDDAIHEGTVGTMNPILSLGLVRMVMQTAMEMSDLLDMDSQARKKWKHILKNMSSYTYQEREGKKVFRYTEIGTDWWRNNTLGIQHIYPAGQIGLDSEPDLLQVAHNTIDVMQRWIDFNGSNSFFPAAVRVGYDPEVILEKLRQYTQNTYANGFQLNNPHGIENYSTVPNTINEMLCMGHNGVLRVFPVWSRHKDASFENIRVHGAFLVSSELKNGEVIQISIESEQGRECNLINPWHSERVQIYRDGKASEILKGKSLSFKTEKGEEILLKSLKK